MATMMPETPARTKKLDNQVRLLARESLLIAWDEQYGLSEEDVLGAACRSDHVYLLNTDWPATECSDRALDIAFAERDKLYEERM